MIGNTDQARVTSGTRQAASLSTFMTNGSVGASGAFATGDGSDTPTGGTDRALTNTSAH